MSVHAIIKTKQHIFWLKIKRPTYQLNQEFQETCPPTVHVRENVHFVDSLHILFLYIPNPWNIRKIKSAK